MFSCYDFQDEIKTLEDNFHSNDKEYSFKVSNDAIHISQWAKSPKKQSVGVTVFLVPN